MDLLIYKNIFILLLVGTFTLNKTSVDIFEEVEQDILVNNTQ